MGKLTLVADPMLTAQFISTGLIDEYALYSVAVVRGAGKPVFLDVKAPLDMDLIESHWFASGIAFQRYAPGRAAIDLRRQASKMESTLAACELEMGIANLSDPRCVVRGR